MEKDKKDKKTIKSVEKAFALIELLSDSREELGVSEISAALDSGVSGTYHLLNTLKELEVIAQNPSTKKYKLGLKLWRIGMRAYSQNELAQALRPFLRKLREKTGETANLTVLDNNRVVYIAQEESDYLLKMFTQIGAAAPLHCTGAGKILLAYQPDYKRELLLDSLELTGFTPKTIIDKESLRKAMAKIRAQGYGPDDEERELGVKCIGAPIFGPDGKILASISISGPKERFKEETREDWIEIVKSFAARATLYLGNPSSQILLD